MENTLSISLRYSISFFALKASNVVPAAVVTSLRMQMLDSMLMWHEFAAKAQLYKRSFKRLPLELTTRLETRGRYHHFQALLALAIAILTVELASTLHLFHLPM